MSCSHNDGRSGGGNVQSACRIEPPAAGAPLAPAAERGFYPLEIGNQWHYNRRYERQIIINNQPPPEPDTASAVSNVELTGVENIDGMDYVVQEERTTSGSGQEVTIAWDRLRQDDTGLYRALVPRGQPPALAWPVADDLPTYIRRAIEANARLQIIDVTAVSEARRLAYPLEVGNSWITADNAQGVLVTVEALDTLSVDAGRLEAFRLRLESANIGSNDSYLRWYGPCGFVQGITHVEIQAIDPGTGETALIIQDEEQMLSGLDLGGESP